MKIPFFITKLLIPREGMTSLELFEFYYALNRRLLRFSGIDTLLETHPEHFWPNIIIGVAALISMNMIFIPQFYAMFFRPMSLAKLLEVMGNNLVAVNYGCKIFVLFYKQKVLLRQEKTWMNLWRETVSPDEIVHLLGYSKKGKALTCCWLCCGLFLTIAYLITPLTVSFNNNFTNGTNLPFVPAKEIESGRTFTYVYITQSITATIIYLALGGADLITPMLILQACGHLRVLRFKLYNIEKQYMKPIDLAIFGDEKGTISNRVDLTVMQNSVKLSLEECIQRHQIILNAVAEIEDSLSLLGLIEALCVVYHICLAGIGILLVPAESYKFYVHIFGALYQLLLFCWPADDLMTESFEVAKAVGCIPWYLCPQNVQTNTLMMIRRAQKICQFTAGGYFVLSLEAYRMLVSKGFSAFAVLRTIT